MITTTSELSRIAFDIFRENEGDISVDEVLEIIEENHEIEGLTGAQVREEIGYSQHDEFEGRCDSLACAE